MDSALKTIHSIINSYTNAPDADRAFTFIEFIKEFGYDNTPTTFLGIYKEYLSEWSKISDKNIILSDKELIRKNMIETLKSIILNYSSYEEQDFIAHLDWSNERHIQAIIPFFAKKIHKICSFYKNKRNELPLIVNKNKLRGSRDSIEQIVYDKIVDFYFNNKNLAPQINDLKNSLTVSIEQYVDIYSDYFDIPRHKKCTDETRQKLLTANINTVHYEDYLEVSKIISDTLFSGDLFLEEIPLIAQVALDFSADCAGDMKNLRDELLYNATLNQVSLNEQVALRRALYRKYLGCDLYYIYSDGYKNLTMDKLVTADNPSGNLLNCGTADTATVEANNIKLLSQIGLFFKPDKMGILKLSADDFKWEIDDKKIEPNTFYIFPDPYKYGDIGNNKDSGYPLIMEYKLNTYIRNISSGYAKDDPLNYICNVTWNTYQTRQDEDYRLQDNRNFDYSFTKLANSGIISNYKTDLFGNEYCLLKGYEILFDGNGNIQSIKVPTKYPLPAVNVTQAKNPAGIIINGGYFVDPRPNYKKFDIRLPFDYNVRMRNAQDYIWTGLKFGKVEYNASDSTSKLLSAGYFYSNEGTSSNIKFVDHYKEKLINEVSDDKTTVSADVLKNFITDYDNSDLFVQEEDKSFYQIHNSLANYILVKERAMLTSEIKKLYFTINGNEIKCRTAALSENISDSYISIKSFSIIKNYIIVYCTNYIFVVQYNHDGETNYSIVYSDKVEDNVIVKPLYVEKYKKFYILKITPAKRQSGNNILQDYLKLEIDVYKLGIDFEKEVVLLVQDRYEDNSNIINPQYLTCEEINHNFDCESSFINIVDVAFTYNTSLNKFAIIYIQHDSETIPTLYEHTFKLFDAKQFKDTLSTVIYTSKYTNLCEIDMIGEPWDPNISLINNFKNLGDDKYPFFIEN